MTALQRIRRGASVVGPWALGLSVLVSGCAPRLLSLPTDPGNPLPDFVEIHRQATSACVGVRTFTAELSLSGRAGGQPLRGRAIAGFEPPVSLRLEGVAPFGPPAFILVDGGDGATLLLPRENRALRGGRAADILGALTGVTLAPADLQAILTGCVASTPGALGGRLHERGWVSIDLPGNTTLYLERVGSGWRPLAAERPGWQIEYPAWQGGFPLEVRLRSVDAAIDVDLTAGVSQIEANITIDPAAFMVRVPADAGPLTLAELREAGPLRAQ
ncbi:MAG: hypothetical protein O2930_05200 [Acidobacteria bacterium]|nr:hypothetical protein [Acidobacteriota bacterium]